MSDFAFDRQQQAPYGNTSMTVLFSIILLCSIFILTWYSLYVLKNFGIKHDLSCTYYHLERRRKGSGKLFSFLLLLIIVFVIPVWIIITINYTSVPRSVAVLPAMVGCGLAVVMFTPRYKRCRQLVYLHYGAAIIAAALSVIWIITVCPRLLMVVAVLSVFLGLLALRTRTLRTCTLFWLELLDFYSIFIILLILLYVPYQ